MAARPPRDTVVLVCPADLSSTPLVLRPRQKENYRLHAVAIPLAVTAASAPVINVVVKNGARDTIAIFSVTGFDDLDFVTFAPFGVSSQSETKFMAPIPPDLIITPEMELTLEADVGAVIASPVVVMFEPLP